MILMTKANLSGEQGVQTKETVDVLFAYMPYHQLSHPALGASILKTCLVKQGINTKIKYYGMNFAERIGIIPYENIKNSESTKLLGEWTFSRAAFYDKDEETKSVISKNPKLEENTQLQKVAELANQWIIDEAEKILQKPPKIVICSSMFQQNVASLAILRRLKEQCPEIKTIMGGPNTEGELGVGLLRRAPWLDYISAGEGEESLPELCQHILSRSTCFQPPKGVLKQSDVGHIDKGQDISTSRAILTSMDKSPEPTFDDYFSDLKSSNLEITPGLLMESSRGCWWGQRSHCTFCGLNGEGMNYRVKDASSMAEQLKSKIQEHRIKRVEFVDNIIDKGYFKSFLPLIEDQDLSLFYETKADFSESDAEQFLKSGVRFIQPGIEALHDSVLKLMRKGTSAALNIECLRLCKEYGLRPAWSILTEFPGEEETWYKETCELLPKLIHLQPANAMIAIRYDRFSPYHDNPAQWGLDLVPYNSYEYVYPKTEKGHHDIAYFFKKFGEEDDRRNHILKQSKTYQDCRELVKRWQSTWNENTKSGKEAPKLLLKKEENKSLIIDSRNPEEEKVTEINDSMVQLLELCRKRKSHSTIKREEYRNTFGDLNDTTGLLRKAIERDWIIDISNHIVTIVQFRETRQPSLENFPGGRVHRKKTKV